MWRSKARAFLFRCPRPIPSLGLQHLPAVRTAPLPLLPLPVPSPSGVRSGLPRFFSGELHATVAGISQKSDFSAEDDGDKEASVSPADSNWSAERDDRRAFSGGKGTPSSVFDDSAEGRKSSAAFAEDREGMDNEPVVNGATTSSSHDEHGCNPDAYELEGDQEEYSGTTGVDMEQVENVVSILQNALPEVLESQLDEMDLQLNEEFVVTVIQAAPASSIDNLITFFAYATRRSVSLKSSSTILEFLVEHIHGFLDSHKHSAFMLWDLVRDIGEKQGGPLNTKILNCMISVFSKLGSGKSVVDVFNKFDEVGCLPDGDTYYHTILALGKPSWADVALSICERMIVSRNFPDGEKVGKIIRFFCKGGKLREAHRLYVTAKDMGNGPPIHYLNLLIKHLSNRDDTLQIALELLEQSPRETLDNAASSFTSVISGFCRIKDTEKAKNLLDGMLESGPPPRNVIFNHVITALCKAHKMEEAVPLLKKMKQIRLTPDIRSYNVVMSAFCKDGLMEEAQKIFDEAKIVHKKLGRVSYHILSRGYCRINEFEKAINIMNFMKDEGIAPNVDDYRKMIQSLCLSSMDWRTAETLVQEMKDNGLSLDGQTHGLVFAVKQLEQEEMRTAGLIPQT